MTTLREAAQMALDVLIDAADSQSWELQQNIDQHGEWYRRSVYLKEAVTKSQEAIESLRAALAQPEQEPQGGYRWRKGDVPPSITYAAPSQREWQGLTDEQIREFEIWLDDEEEKRGWNPPADIVKYIEAKLREKNFDRPS